MDLPISLGVILEYVIDSSSLSLSSPEIESFKEFLLLQCYSHSENRLLGVYFWHILEF